MAELYGERFRGCEESWHDSSECVEDTTPEKRVLHYFYSSWNNVIKIL